MFLESWARFFNSRGGFTEKGSCRERGKVASRRRPWEAITIRALPDCQHIGLKVCCYEGCPNCVSTTWSHVLTFLCCYSLRSLCFIALTILCAHFAMFLLQIESGCSPITHREHDWHRPQPKSKDGSYKPVVHQRKVRLGDWHHKANLQTGTYFRACYTV